MYENVNCLGHIIFKEPKCPHSRKTVYLTLRWNVWPNNMFEAVHDKDNAYIDT